MVRGPWQVPKRGCRSCAEMPSTKKTAARPRAARRTPARGSRSAGRRGGGGRLRRQERAAQWLPTLDERQRDVIALALIAVGVFLGFVLYGSWNGGRAGHGLAVALGWSV